MASKQKQRVGEVQRAKGVLYEESNGTYKLTKQHYTKDELLVLLRTLGKRAQTRIKTLSRYFDERGKKYTGQINPIYDRYKGYDIKYQGLSTQALYKKVSTAIDILNARQSTYTGYMSLQYKAYHKFLENHPKRKDMTFEEWRQMVVYMGQWQSAHEGEQYDSDTLVAMASWARETGQLEPLDFKEVDLDKWFLDTLREGNTGKWLDLDEDFDDI